MSEPQRRPVEARRPSKDNIAYMKVRDRHAIRRARLKRRYSQRDLAGLCRKSQQAISQLESGVLTTLTEAFAMEIANRLDLSWEDVFEAPRSSVMLDDESHVSTDAGSRRVS